jgi:hypothetical protein
MTVQKLIFWLRKMPPQAIVVWRDHDMNVDEINGYVTFVREAEPELEAELERRHGRKLGVVTLSE